MSAALCIERATPAAAALAKPESPRRATIKPEALAAAQSDPWAADLLVNRARRLPRLPWRPYCSDDLERGLRIRPLEQALKRANIQVNPPQAKLWLTFDLDFRGAAFAWEDAGLPAPTWTATNPENGHAHLAWGLAVPVLMERDDASEHAMRYLAAIEGCMAARLGADMSYGGLTTKNPLSPRWIVHHCGRVLLYELGELAEYLPGIEKYRLPRRAEEQVGVGRNVSLFDKLRKWAYKAIRDYWKPGAGGWDTWVEHCRASALAINAQFPTPLHWSEVRHVAKSVARWTWKHTTPESFGAWCSRRGKASGAARRAASEPKRAQALELHAAGLSQRAIAAEVGVTQKTISLWLKAAAEAQGGAG